MPYKELLRHHKRIDKVKFFVKKHDKLVELQDGLASSIFININNPV